MTVIKLSSKELLIILISSIILSFSYSYFLKNLFLISFFYFLLILFFYTLIQKITAIHYEADTELELWKESQYGFAKEQHFKNLIPIGIILSLIIPFLTYGTFFWLAITQTKIKARKERVARRHGIYSFAELTDSHIAYICSSAIFFLLFLSFVSYLLNLTLLSKLSIYFSFFNLLPLGNLDGSKIFFGERLLWLTLFFINCICIFYSIFII